MKNIRKHALFLALIALVLLSSCELLASRMRSLPPVIQIFNSRLERTLKMVPNDTMYVKVSGLRATTNYTIQALDPSGGLISELQTVTDANGGIGISPLWYDVGFKTDASTGNLYLDDTTDLALRAFNVRVYSTDDNGTATDFELPFFFVNTTVLDRPQPIVMAGKKVNVSGTDRFFLDNAFKSDNASPSQTGDELYVKVANMTNLGSASATASTTARVYIVPFNGIEWEEGQDIDPNAHWFYQDCTLAELTAETGILIQWPVSSPSDTSKQARIPQYAKSAAYTVVLDVGSDGKYNVLKTGTTTYHLDGIDGNGVAGFIVKEPPVPPAAAYIPLNLASTGIFNYEYNPTTRTWGYTYGYANTFNKTGAGTNYASHTQAEFYGYGLKVIWNPYGSYTGVGGAVPNTGLYWGATVDVYIVKSTQPLTVNAPITQLATGTAKRRVPVQSGCSNGYYQQTIWRPTMVPGNYMLIVDMDKSGTVTDRDLVDTLATDGTARTIDSLPAGFSVY